jgi:hypothetical protein
LPQWPHGPYFWQLRAGAPARSNPHVLNVHCGSPRGATGTIALIAMDGMSVCFASWRLMLVHRYRDVTN